MKNPVPNEPTTADNPAQMEFLCLVEMEADSRCPGEEWLPAAMKVIHLVPDRFSAPAASATLMRWLSGEPPHEHDLLLLEFLTPGAEESTGRAPDSLRREVSAVPRSPVSNPAPQTPKF